MIAWQRIEIVCDSIQCAHIFSKWQIYLSGVYSSQILNRLKYKLYLYLYEHCTMSMPRNIFCCCYYSSVVTALAIILNYQILIRDFCNYRNLEKNMILICLTTQCSYNCLFNYFLWLRVILLKKNYNLDLVFATM